MSPGKSTQPHQSLAVLWIALGAVATVVFVIWLSMRFMAIVIPTGDYGRTSDMTPARIELTAKQARTRGDASQPSKAGLPETILFIPKAYMTETKKWGGGRYERVTIEADYSTLRPRDLPPTLKAYDRSAESLAAFRAYQHSRLLFYLHAVKERDISDWRYRRLKEKMGKFGLAHVGERYGLQRYQAFFCPPELDVENKAWTAVPPGCRLQGDDDWVALDAQGRLLVYVHCSSPQGNWNDVCRLYNDTFEFSVEIVLLLGQMKDWKAILSGVLSLVESFKQGQRTAR